jgi:DNA-binding transcriptional LysR family regulator
LDIKQLTYFVEVAKEKSFTRAAANCFVSQPALSKSIRQLETELNSKLFIRDYANFELTKEGEILLEDAMDIINSFNNIKSRIEMTRTKVAHPIKIAVSPFLGNACFGNIIAEFCEVNPGMPIDYYESDKLAAPNLNYLKEIDIAILLLPQQSEEMLSDYHVTELTSCRLVGLMSSQNAPKRLTLKAFLNETIITAGDILQIIHANDLKQVGKKHVFSSSNADYVKRMILHKGGILILPDFIAKAMTDKEPQYQLVPMKFDIICRVVLITKRHMKYGQLVAQIQKYICSEFERIYQ